MTTANSTVCFLLNVHKSDQINKLYSGYPAYRQEREAARFILFFY